MIHRHCRLSQLIYIQPQTQTVCIYKHVHTNGSAEHIVPLLIYITFLKQEGCY